MYGLELFFGFHLMREISKIYLAIIRLALVEIFHDKTVPTSVAINEAVQLSKKFSDDGSYQFVNGILGNIVREK